MDTITYQAASDIDRAWCDARWPSDGLRIVVDWVGGQGNVTHLRVPGMNYSPLYQWREYTETGEFAPAFYHVSGPTLADWQAEMDRLEKWCEDKQAYSDLVACVTRI